MEIILSDLKINLDVFVKLYCDDKLAMSISYISIQEDGIKHIEIDRHFIKKNLDIGLVVTTHIPIRFQIVVNFTRKGFLMVDFKIL